MSDALVILEVILVSGTVLTLPVAIILLWVFRRSVQKEMSVVSQTHGTSFSQVDKHAVGACAPSQPLTVRLLTDSVPRDRDAESSWYDREAERSIRQAVLIYSLGGFAFAVTFALGWVLQAGLTPGRLAVVTAYFWWPAVLAIELIAAGGVKQSLKIAAPYFLVVAAVSAFELAYSPKLTIAQLTTLWLLVNAQPTLMMLAFLRRRVRAVGPLILTFMIVGLAGASLAWGLLLKEAVFGFVFRFGNISRIGVNGAIVTGCILGFLVLAVAGWWLLRGIGELHREKRISDRSLTLDVLFGLFAIVGCLFIGVKYVWIGPTAFLAYKLSTWAGVKYLMARPNRGDQAPILLLLRVFSLGKRSERLFDELTKRWRCVGSIGLVAGPDLISNTTQPAEFLDFLGGKLSRRFVLGQDDLEKRVLALDRAPDPDGRYRVNQFFCNGDSWRTTVRRLMPEASAVLMDLRSFSTQNEGCIYELQQILNSIDLRRALFVVDSTTNRQFLEEVLQRLWMALPPDSPNYSSFEPSVRLFFVRSQSGVEVRSLLRALSAAVIPQRLPTPAGCRSFKSDPCNDPVRC